MKKIIITIFACFLITAFLSACSKSSNSTVVIYTSAEDYRIEAMQKDLDVSFPDYEIIIEYY